MVFGLFYNYPVPYKCILGGIIWFNEFIQTFWLTIKPSSEVIDEDVKETDTERDEDAGKIGK